jgi:hypothetical protein
MKTIRIAWQSLFIAAVFLFWTDHSEGTETNTLRLAIGPFYAPPGDPATAKVASELPDLLAAVMPTDGRFQLVERDKVKGIWNELQLGQAGLTSPDTVMKLGRMLSCDWLVSGTFYEINDRLQIWVKVISTQDSVVLDLQSVPYIQTNLPATADAIVAFLAQARAHKQAREFIALGKFSNWSISAAHPDWSQRLQNTLEKQLLAAGYGVVEREALAPIFTEYQFQTAKLIAATNNVVKLKPAFWVVDGSCKWIHDTQDKLTISISVQKMGGGEQIFSLTKPAGDELEKAVVETVKSALADSGSVTLAQAQAGEEKLLAEHLDQFSHFREPRAPLSIPTNDTFITITDAWGQTRQMKMNPAMLEMRQKHAEAFTEEARKAILLNPNDMHAKFTLGMNLYGRSDAIENKEGEDLLAQVAASGSADSIRASNWLSDIKTGKITREKDPMGFWKIVSHGQPASMPVMDSNATNQLAKFSERVNAQLADERRHTNAIPHALSVAPLVSGPAKAPEINGFTAAKLWQHKVFIASGSLLQVYDMDTGLLEPVDFPFPVKDTINAIEADENELWLGTAGGLLRVSLPGGAVRVFTEKDGLPAPSVTALRKVANRLFMGLAGNGGGAFGYLDIGSEKFTGLMSGADVKRDWNKQIRQAPSLPIHAIATVDGTNFWVSSNLGVQQFDLKANAWDLAMPKDFIHEIGLLGENSLSVNPHFVAAVDYKHCAALRHLPDQEWTRLDVATNQDLYYTVAIALEPNADQLWVGGDSLGNVQLIDLAKSEIIAEGNLSSPGMGQVLRILPGPDKVVVIAGRAFNETCAVHCLNKPGVAEAPFVTAKTGAPLALDFRGQFLQKNFSKFAPVQFEKDIRGNARLQRLPVKQCQFESGGSYYCGFRFTVPPWLDGNLAFMYTLFKNESEKNYTITMDSHIITEEGVVPKLDHRVVYYLGDCPELQQQLPYTVQATLRLAERAELQPGKTYAIWFEYDDPNLPDIAFAITIDSGRGYAEFGALPEFDSARLQITARTAPTTAEELRAQFETALKTKDRDAFVSLADLENVSDDDKRSFIDGRVNNLLNQDVSRVELAPLDSSATSHERNGIRTRPNLPLTGWLRVFLQKGYMDYDLPYGQKGPGFYMTVYVNEAVGK